MVALGSLIRDQQQDDNVVFNISLLRGKSCI